MNIKKIALAAALVASSSAAVAWVGPFSNGYGDGLMDGDFAFSMRSSARGHGYGYPAYGYGPYGYAPYGYGYAPYAAPALTEDQKAAFEAQQKAAAEMQKQAQEQAKAAFEAQQKAAAEFYKNAPKQSYAYGPRAGDEFFKQVEAQHQAEIKAQKEQMDAMRKQMEEQRQATIEAHKKSRGEFVAMRKAPFEAK